MTTHSLIPAERIERRILLLRRQKVMLDRDLAELYGVPTGRLNEQVRRNLRRFPSDFVFQLSPEEAQNLRSHFAISRSRRWGGRRYVPLAFTEQGVAMLSSVLHSERAVLVNVAIMRAFVRLRRLLASNEELARKLESLEKRYDERFRVVFDAIRRLMAPLERSGPKERIGFRAPSKRSGTGRAALRGRLRSRLRSGVPHA